MLETHFMITDQWRRQENGDKDSRVRARSRVRACAFTRSVRCDALWTSDRQVLVTHHYFLVIICNYHICMFSFTF